MLVAINDDVENTSIVCPVAFGTLASQKKREKLLLGLYSCYAEISKGKFPCFRVLSYNTSPLWKT